MPSGTGVTVTTVKHHQLNPDKFFINTYEALTEKANVTMTELETLGRACLDFEAALTLPVIEFEGYRISTFRAEGDVYDPFSFFTRRIVGLFGLYAGGGDAMPLTSTMNLQRAVSTGKSGKLILRGCLSEGDVISPAGFPIPADRLATIGRIITATNTAGMDAYFEIDPAVPNEVFSIAMLNAVAANNRKVADLDFQKFGTLKMKFNRHKPNPLG